MTDPDAPYFLRRWDERKGWYPILDTRGLSTKNEALDAMRHYVEFFPSGDVIVVNGPGRTVARHSPGYGGRPGPTAP